MKAKTLALGIIAAVIVTGLLSAALIFNIASLERIKALEAKVGSADNEPAPDDADEPSSDGDGENGVVIADDYMIESTEQISDAYISGDATALSEKDGETLKMASDVLDEIIEDGMTDYEKEEAVYVWMTTKLQNDPGLLPVIPTADDDSDNPYGVLKYHNAVCVGYATTFRLFMQMLGIECHVVHNSECYHSWDLVKIGDGWYHTDIYSDASSGNYSHFNRTDSMQMQDQSWDTELFPAADSYEYCYMMMKAKECDSIYDIPAIVRSTLDARESFLSLKFNADEAKQYYSAIDMMMSDISSRVMSSEEFANSLIYYNISPADEWYLLALTAEYNDEDEPDPADYGISDEDYKKINGSIDDAFGDLTQNEDYYGGYYFKNGANKTDDAYYYEYTTETARG
ncbi:MAG: transglutaminase domain-containing protein [Clostridia bacterium]|nr:transglutaminase domain-containing protein [Clostridia bacterium]